mgnify:CR=1 FL=1
MKTTISLFAIICLFTGMELLAQDVDITGNWTMFEMTWTTADEVNTTTEEQLKAEEMFSDYSFMPEGKLNVVSNMIGTGNVETMEGTWKLEEDKLTTGFTIEGNQMDIVWGFEFKDDVIYLSRTSPDGSATVVNSFKRK